MANIIKETVRGIDVVSIEDELLKNREMRASLWEWWATPHSSIQG